MIVYHGTAGAIAAEIERDGLAPGRNGGVGVTPDLAIAKEYARTRTAGAMILGYPNEGLIVVVEVQPNECGAWRCCADSDQRACSHSKCVIHDYGFPVTYPISPERLELRRIHFPELDDPVSLAEAYLRGDAPRNYLKAWLREQPLGVTVEFALAGLNRRL